MEKRRKSNGRKHASQGSAGAGEAALLPKFFPVPDFVAGFDGEAQLMGQQSVARLLEQNLRQEQEMAKKVSQLSQQLGRQATGAVSAR